MSSCNLAETVHNKWLQQSGNRGNDLYVETVDNYVRAFMQMVRYYQYLKGNQVGTEPGREELILHIAQHSAKRTSNPRVLTEAIASIPEVDEFSNRNPHFKGEEVFGLQKQKVEMPLGCEYDSHRPNKVNFSHPHIQTRSKRPSISVRFLNPISEHSFEADNVVMDDEWAL